MANTKSCKFCMTEIARKARICPQCHRPQAALARLKASFSSGVMTLVALVSFAFGFNQKFANLDATAELKHLNKNLATARGVIGAGMKQSQDLMNKLAPEARTFGYGGAAPTRDPKRVRIEEIDKLIEKQLEEPAADWAKIEQLQKEQQELQQKILTGED